MNLGTIKFSGSLFPICKIKAVEGTGRSPWVVPALKFISDFFLLSLVLGIPYRLRVSSQLVHTISGLLHFHSSPPLSSLEGCFSMVSPVLYSSSLKP